MKKKSNLDLWSLLIERIIIHDIPKRRKAQMDIVPYYSEQDTEIPDGTRMFFKERIISALQSIKAFNICYDNDIDSPVPLYVDNLLTSTDDIFVDQSKKMADRLLNVQDGVNAAGILLVISGKIDDKKICVLMKLEKDNGLQLERNNQTNSFDIKEIKDLMLTHKTRLFKVGLLFQRKDFNLNYDGTLMDFQIDIRAKKEIQTFFMAAFLGCKPYNDPKVATRKFYKYTRIFIESMIDDKIAQAKYTQDLNSYIQKNQSTVCPKEFADEYFTDSTHKDNYKKYIQEKKIPYSRAVVKDTTLINNQIKEIRVFFHNGVTLVGNKGTLDKKVEFSKLENGQDKAEIISKIKKIS